MRGLIVGLGSIGRRHARNWAALGLGRLAVYRSRKAALPEPLGIEVVEYDDLQRALELEHPDAVIVCNPTSLHLQTACTALQCGANVLVEKPLADTLDGVVDLLDLGQRSERLIGLGYHLRFHPGLLRLKALAETHAVGRLVSARAECGEYLPDWHPWEDYREGYAARRDLGGGAVLTFSHELDALCWLLGPPRRVTALTAHASALELDVEDVAEMAFEFESGAIGSVHVDFVRRPRHRAIELVGERGVLRWDYDRDRLEVFAADTGQWRLEQGSPRVDRNDMYKDELRHFASWVRGETAVGPIADGEQGAAVLAIGLAALRSASEGRAVDFRAEDESVRAWLARLGNGGYG
jgi:predicted dehydrogenase